MRCPNCGSNKIELINIKSGYSMSKGLAGAVVLGPVGAVAGLDGKKEQIFKCPMCGTETHNLMESSLDNEITVAITRAEVYGNNIDKLRQFKANYPNIEWVESLTKSSISSDKASIEGNASQTHIQENQNSGDVFNSKDQDNTKRFIEHADEFIKSQESNLKTLEWECEELIEKQKEAELIKAQLKDLKENSVKTIEKEKEKISDEISEIEQSIQQQEAMLNNEQIIISEKNKQISNCSIFQGKIKKQLRQEIDVATDKINTYKKSISDFQKKKQLAQEKFNSVERDIQKQIDEKEREYLEANQGQAISDYNFKINKIKQTISRIKSGDYQQDDYVIWLKVNYPTKTERLSTEERLKNERVVVLEGLDKLVLQGPTTTEELVQILRPLDDGTIINANRLSAILYGLSRDGLVTRMKKGETYYYELI